MKPHISGESSLADESKRSIGEKLHHVYKAAMDMVAITNDASKQSMFLNQRWSSHHAEDPIRTLMFLGSSSHT
ncbi:hypothetical protein SESBI_20364 [Sesbania bispinosa]|nr:hypothetical protein SESBI_20364 [Sesbania bispinosa]